MKTKSTYEKKEAFQASWSEVLQAAVTVPGTISAAFSMFHGYSTGNQMLAMFQCSLRGIQPGPIASFNGWKKLGRSVKKGEKAIALLMPVTFKSRSTKEADADAPEDAQQTGGTFHRFIFRNNWFVLSQTEGEEYKPEPLADWSEADALKALEITKIPFDSMNGNVQGFARTGRQVAINPLDQQPHATLFHEIAHVLLHQGEPQGDKTAKNIKELEAEAVALLCLESLGLPGADSSRGYIQSWYKENTIPERSAQRIFSAADKILKAGRPAEKEAAADAPAVNEQTAATFETIQPAAHPKPTPPAPAEVAAPTIPAFIAATEAPAQQGLFA